MDGTRSDKELLAEFPADAREPAAQLLAAHPACGVVDTTGRALGHNDHAATKKGVL
jgi:hypothetical protein